jgi:hypothetical protein
VVQQGILQGAVRIARRRVHHQAGGFVDDQQRGVLMDQIQRDILGQVLHLRVESRLQHYTLATVDLLPGTQADLAIETYTTLSDPLLQPGAGKIGEQGGQGLVQAFAGELSADLPGELLHPVTHCSSIQYRPQNHYRLKAFTWGVDGSQ